MKHIVIFFLAFTFLLRAKSITATGEPGLLEIRAAGACSIRITLKPKSFASAFPLTSVLPEREYPAALISLQEISQPVRAEIAGMLVEVLPEPLSIIVKRKDGALIQSVNLLDDGKVSFTLDSHAVLGMGEGGAAIDKKNDWRNATVSIDRRGALDHMRASWGRQAYGSRNPVPLLIGTAGWALYFSTPWGTIDLRDASKGIFSPTQMTDEMKAPQTTKNQAAQLSKGIPPYQSYVAGLLDFFIFDGRDPAMLMKDISTISGAAVMPPKWAFGYMQSHRTLEDDAQMLKLVDTFREKKIPLDAVIYLGTGFTPQGWNTQQPSFQFNPKVFKHDPEKTIAELHAKNVKVALHIVPQDRDALPTLQGSIPRKNDEVNDASHIENYWAQHKDLVKKGVDAWWPDEGDWFNLFERIKRHELYYTGAISSQADRRPWCLHRNGTLGIARWGGWMWSGDTDASWKTLETQIAVGINHSLSLSPYWGSDIGGFFSNKELTGELYARWHQFAAFTPSFRAHGRTWWTRLPWGWGLEKLGPIEDPEPPLLSELHNPEIEKITRRTTELRYQLLSYNYNLAWQARETGMPLMRALWLHYPNDTLTEKICDEYLWGRDLLIAPVFQKSATERKIYLPAGNWYDYWTKEKSSGRKTITRSVDLATIPIYVRAGSILPLDPIRQYTGEKIEKPLSIEIYRGANGEFTLYEDDGENNDYLKGKSALTHFTWDEKNSTLTINNLRSDFPHSTAFHLQTFPDHQTRDIRIPNSAKYYVIKF